MASPTGDATRPEPGRPLWRATPATPRPEEAGLRAEHDRYAAEPARSADHDLPTAAAVVVVRVPGGLLAIAWSGDARAYLLLDGNLRLLTEDHNARRPTAPTGT
ncbi:hypothetical protein AMK17_38205 [Streptomyces sp. CB00072]|uniref:hypothetical protein n=1 Tax=Streptomyces sp. CB00072 TaxID=1703928 RepID=UPI000938E417|nr:hypothetical protein [Streptomyces sp. CB00072]OKI49471.1 hypothetical protein AMK17_38205 [Streptomyces sp. CB00072]